MSTQRYSEYHSELGQVSILQMKYLGYVVDKNGLHVDADKVRAMLELPSSPINVSEVMRLFETFSLYRRFVFSIVAPITALLRKKAKFVWSEGVRNIFVLLTNVL